MTKGLPRWLRWVLWLVLPLLIIYFTLNVVLTSTAFSRFVLDQVEGVVPELQFSQVRGNFIRGLSLNLHYDSPGVEVLAQGANLQLGLECLWQLKLCIRRIHADELRVVLHEIPQEEEPEPRAELELPDVELPVDVFLQSLTVGSLQILQDQEMLYRLDGLDAALSWQGSTLSVERLHGADAWCQWGLAGQVSLNQRYPLDLRVICESIQDFGEAVADITGDLHDLRAQLSSHLTSEFTDRPAQLSASINLAPLNAELPIRARLEAEPVGLQVAEMVVDLQGAELMIDGPLLSPSVQAGLRFGSPFWDGGNELNLDLDASTQDVVLNELLLQLPEGQVSVTGRLDFSAALSWRGQLQWRDIALEQFAEGLDGRVQGQIISAVDYENEDLRAELRLDSVMGTILDWSFAASGQFGYADDLLRVEDLDVQQGDNHLRLAGHLSLEDESNLQLNLDLPQLRQLIPEQWLEQFDGALEGQLVMSGTLEQPALEGRLMAQRIAYGDIHLQQGELSVNWQGASQSGNDLRLHLDQLTLAEGLAAQLTVSASGGQSDHNLAVNVQGLQQHQDKRVLLQCQGGFADLLPSPWQGQCERLDLDFRLSEDQQWRLQAPIQLAIDPQLPDVSISAFCLRYAEASLCNQEAIRYQGDTLTDVALAADGILVRWFQAFLPAEDVELAGALRVEFQGADLLTAAPRLNASLSSTDLALIWTGGETPLRLEAQDLGVGWQLVQQRHQLSWNLQTAGSGSTQGEVSLFEEALDGQLIINGIQLADYGYLFLPGANDEIAGEVNAELTVAGTLQQPMLNGGLSLAQGHFRSDMVPLPIEDIELQLAIQDNNAAIGGEFRAAESQGRLEGDFTWKDESWSGNLSIAADPLLVQPEPKMRIYLAPDLRFAFEPNRIAITGKVAIPRAQVEITELPESAVSTSSDTVIVGATETESGTPLDILADIELVLGDKVFFEGFGLETNITGNLRVQQRGGEMMRANGRLSLVEGRYNAYAQNLVIRSGDLVFVGDIDNPQLRVEAIRGDTPESIIVGLRASGSARNPKVSLFSQPDMPQQAQLSWLITGSAPGTSSDIDPQTAAAEAALSYALESSVGAGITRRAGDALGIEDLQVTAGSTDAGTQIGLSGYVTPRLLVRYGVGVFDAINTWTLRYQVSRSVYLEAISGEASDVGVMWSFERN